MATLTASVIICTRDRLEPLVRCLGSIAEQTYPISQLIIVDSSESPVHSAQAFVDAFSAGQFPITELIYLHTKPGLTFQRNQGVALARAGVVFFFDDDVTLSPRFVAYLMEVFEEHPEYGGGMGTIAGVRLIQKRPVDRLRRFFLLNYSASDGRMQKSGMPRHPTGRSTFMEVEVLSGGLTAYRAQVLAEFAFDEVVTGYAYMEDVDFSYRVSRRHRLFYDPRAVIEHHHPPAAWDQSADNRRMYLVNYHYFFFKNIYADCRWCVLHHLWAVFGLFVIALLGGRWQALRGYCRGLREILDGRLRGLRVLSSR